MWLKVMSPQANLFSIHPYGLYLMDRIMTREGMCAANTEDMTQHELSNNAMTALQEGLESYPNTKDPCPLH